MYAAAPFVSISLAIAGENTRSTRLAQNVTALVVVARSPGLISISLITEYLIVYVICTNADGRSVYALINIMFTPEGITKKPATTTAIIAKATPNHLAVLLNTLSAINPPTAASTRNT